MVYSLPLLAPSTALRRQRDRRAELVGSHEVTGTQHTLTPNNEPDFFPQLPRPVFDGAIQWAMKAERTTFWRSQRRPATKVESPRESIVSMRKGGTSSTPKQNRTEE